MSPLLAERLLAMSAFEAAYLIRSYRRENPSYSNEQLIQTIRSVRADFFPNDYESGLALEITIGKRTEPVTDNDFYRASIEAIIEEYEPLWIRLAPGGRDLVMKAVSINGIQCFRNAGLLEAPPSKFVSDWWDALSGRVRAQQDANKLARGREAERKSYELEVARVANLGILAVPKWTSIEDNNAGFDILSFNPGSPDPTNKLIEVKSSIQEPPTFVITRGEWEAAMSYGEAYHFHFWNLSTGQMIEATPAQVAKHIPSDNGLGRWQKTDLTLPDLLLP